MRSSLHSFLRSRVPRFIIDIAAPSVALYGPVEVLCLPVERPPDDETTATDVFYRFLIRR